MKGEKLTAARAVAQVTPHVDRLARAVRELARDEEALRPPARVYTAVGARRLPPLVELHGALELALVDRLVPALRSLRRELARTRRRAKRRRARKQGRP